MNKSENKYELNITHLYPDKMNLYGDLGNVICLQKRCEWRGIDVRIQNITLGDELDDIATDIYFFGGGQDQDQLLVFEDLIKDKRDKLVSDLNAGVCMLAICGGYQLLGQYFLDSAGNRIEGLGILPIETVAPGPELKQRAIGNLITSITNSELGAEHRSGLQTLVGFENHSGRTRVINSQQVVPLGKVLAGEGDNEDGLSDGIIYKNIVGSYMHGSLLPKNPHLADFLIKRALERKYKGVIKLPELDDSAEVAAHRALLQRYKLA